MSGMIFAGYNLMQIPQALVVQIWCLIACPW